MEPAYLKQSVSITLPHGKSGKVREGSPSHAEVLRVAVTAYGIETDGFGGGQGRAAPGERVANDADAQGKRRAEVRGRGLSPTGQPRLREEPSTSRVRRVGPQ
jgi:hypothetical protein